MCSNRFGNVVLAAFEIIIFCDHEPKFKPSFNTGNQIYSRGHEIWYME